MTKYIVSENGIVLQPAPGSDVQVDGTLTAAPGGTIAATTSQTVTDAAQPTITSVGTLTALDIDNININGNTIITSNVDGDLVLAPNGTGNVSVTKNMVITGDLTINGTTNTINTTNTVASDALIELGNGTTGVPANDAGIVIERGNLNNAWMGWDESGDFFTVGTGTFTGASTGNLTYAEADFQAATITASTEFAGIGTSLTSLTPANISAGNLGSGVIGYATASGVAADYKVSFVNTTGDLSGNFGTMVDAGTGEFTYNPSTNTLVAGTFSGALSGNATSATSATTAVSVTGTSQTAITTLGTITGATSITSTAFVGPLTGDVTGNVTGTAASVTGAAQLAITSLGTLTDLQVDNINVNLNTISGTGDINITPSAGSAIVLDGTISVDAGVISGATSITSTTFTGSLTGNADTATTSGTVTSAAQPNITSTGTLTSLAVDNISIDINTISSTDLNGNILLDPNGTGLVQAVGTNALILPIGTSAQRPTASAGMVRYNSDLAAMEVYDGGWTPLVGTAATSIAVGDTSVSIVDAGSGTITMTVDSLTQMTITATTADFQDNDIITTGSITSGNTTFGGPSPQTILTETGVTANNTKWRTIVDTETLYHQLLDDAETGAGTYIQVGRTANTCDSIAFTTTSGSFSNDLTVTGNLTVNGTTTTLNTTNTAITDQLIELNSGATSNPTNDCGIVIERGSTGDNAIMAWDESATEFVVGTTTATGVSTGALTIADARLRASTITASIGFSGPGSSITSLTPANISAGNLGSGVNSYHTAVTGSSNFKVLFSSTTADASGNFLQYMDAGTGEFTYNPSTNTLVAGTFSGALSGNATTATSATSASSVAATGVAAGNLGSGVLGYATVSAAASAFKVPFLNTTGVASGNFGLLHDSASTFTYNPSTDTLTATNITGTASTAQYADLAENYVADQNYEPGTVLMFGGTFEVTQSTVNGDQRVAGVVTTDPAYLMNSAQAGKYIAPIALRGRVPCKVQGTIHKGDMLVSVGDGSARAEANPSIGSVIGKALESFSGGNGVIEVVI